MSKTVLHPLRISFRRLRRSIIRYWRLHAVVPRLLRFNAYSGFIGRRLFQYIPFLLPHDKSYYGFMHLVKPGDGLFLDVGANDGISAIGFHHIHNDYRILSIEPNRCHEASLKRLLRKLKGFDYRIIGAGEHSERKILYVPFFQGVPIYTAASLDEHFVKSSMIKQFNELECKAVVYEQQVIEIKRLDELNLKPDIIKIDTEGHDFSVLKGLVETLRRHRPSVLIEFNPSLYAGQKEFFDAFDYQLFAYDFKKDDFVVFDPVKQAAILQQRKEAQNIFCVPRAIVNTLPVRPA